MLRSPERSLGLMSKLNVPNRRLALWGGVLTLFAWSYWPTLLRTVEAWRSDPDYTHGFLVIPIALAIWFRRAQPDERHETDESFPDRQTVMGLTLLAAAAVLRISAARYYLMPLDVWSIPLWIGGVIWTFAGWRTFRVALPSIAFLWFAAPLPERVEQLLSIPLQLQAATASAWVLQALCQPAVASGTTLLLGAEIFEVEHACSGLRMFFGTFAMACAFVLLGSRGRALNVLLILLAAPIAVLANIIRIVITALLFQHASTELLRRFVHDFAGLMMVAVVFSLYSLVLFVARLIVRSHQANRDRFARLLPIWPIAAFSLAILVVLWQQQQERRVFASLLETATFYEESREWGKAADYLDRYLQFQRDDPQVLRRLANAVQRSAVRLPEQRRALKVLAAASKANPDDLELAGRQAELAWVLRQFGQVIATTTPMLDHASIDRPENLETRQLAVRLRAWAMYETLTNSDGYASFNWPDVAESLTVATQFDPHYPQHAFRLAIVYRERLKMPSPAKRNELADQLINRLVQEHPESSEAWLVRYRYRRRFHRTDEMPSEELASIDEDLRRALELDALDDNRNVHILIAAAERMRERGDMDDSLTHYQLALQVNARDVRPYLAIAEIWTERGTIETREKAVDVLRQGLAIIGSDEVPLIYPLIEQLVVLGRTQEADAYVVQAEDALERFSEPIRTSYRIQLQHVEAWRLAKDEDFVAAAKSLEELLDTLPSKYVHVLSNYVAQSWANVGQYYRMARNWDQASKAYQRAAALDGVWRLEYRWSLARQSEVHGQLSDAVRQYQQIADRADDSLNAWIQAAAVALRQQILLPTEVRDWTSFRRAIDAAKAVAGSGVDEVIVLEANQMMILGQHERVTRLLFEAIKTYPESSILYRSLALVQARRGDLSGALKTAEQMNPLSGDATASVLLRKELLCNADRADEAIELLRTTLNSAGEKDTISLQLELAQLYMQDARWVEARQWLDLATKTDSRDLRVTETLSELAWCLEDWDLLEQCEVSLREMEGTYGPLWRTFRIRRLLAQSGVSHEGATTSSGAAEEVDGLARQLEVLYPHMQQTRIAAGRVATYRGLLWRAVANYEEAWDLGLPRVSLAVDLIGLLNELGETDRAQRYVHEVRSFLAATQSVIDQSFLELSNESGDEAIRMAEALVRDTPKSESYVRLGRTLVLTALPQHRDYDDRLKRAETAFRQAVEVAPTNTRTWAALFRYLVAVKSDPLESQEVLHLLAEREDISQLNRTFVLAQLNESIENYAKAKQLFDESLRLADEESIPAEQLVVLERAAQYFRRFEPELSEQCCRRALAIDDSAIGPQQILLELLLAKQTQQAAAEAKQVVESVTEYRMGSDQWKRLRARVLLQASKWDEHGLSSRRRAVELLEAVTNKTSSDALLLAELHLLSNQQAAAVSELRAVSKNLPVDGDRVLSFLRKFDTELYADARTRTLAERIYDQLEEQSDYCLKTLDLRCETSIQRVGGTHEQRQAMMSSLINQYVRRGLERAASENDQFEVLVGLMHHLVNTGRWQETRQLTQLRSELLRPPRAAVALATALATSDPTDEHVQSLAKAMDQWLVDYPNNAELLFAVANVHVMFGQSDRAIELFGRSLKASPQQSTSLNNLALAMAVHDPSSIDECFDLVNRAIELDGRDPQWLDTLAVLHLIHGDYDQAVTLLLEALPRSGSDELLFLHLAKAWMELGDQSMASFALSMAESRTMKERVLLPFDQEIYQQVVNRLRVSTR